MPQVHEKISELHEFTETFLYYFSHGVNAERVSVSAFPKQTLSLFLGLERDLPTLYALHDISSA